MNMNQDFDLLKGTLLIGKSFGYCFCGLSIVSTMVSLKTWGIVL